MLRALALSVLFAGCLQPASHNCADGTVCPSQFTCDIQGHCVDPVRAAACAGKAEGDLCTVSVADDGSCAGGQCVSRTCGNGVVQPGERCDDGNREDGDGCRGDCASEETCGNGVIDVAQGEQCDCGAGAEMLGPGCDAPNAVDGFCRPDCILQCGDGVVRGNETCDGGPPAGESCLDYGYDLGNLGCSPICSTDIASCDRIGWHTLATPTMVTLPALWAASATLVYACDSEGSLLRFDGASATRIPALTSNQALLDIWGSGPSDVFAVGFDRDAMQGIVEHYDGSAWSRMTIPAVGSFVAVTGRSATDVWAVTSASVLHYDGSQWTLESLPTSDLFLLDIATAGADIYAVGTDLSLAKDVVLRRSAGVWSTVTTPAQVSPTAVWASSATDVWIGGELPTLLHFDGAWTQVQTSSSNQVTDIAGLASGAMYVAQGDVIERWDGRSLLPVPNPGLRRLAVFDEKHLFGTDGSRVLRATGHDWSLMSLGSDPQQGVFGFATDDVYTISGDEAMIDHWNGASWETIPVLGDDIDHTELWASGGTLFLAGAAGLLKYDGTWTSIATPQAPLAVWGTGPSNVFVVGGGGMIGTYTGTWSSAVSPTTQTLNDVWGRNASDVFAVGDGGAIVHFDGSAWSTMASGTTANLRGVSGGATSVYAVGDGTVLRLQGGTWQAFDLGVASAIRGVYAVADDDVYAVGDDESILHFDGAQWGRIRSPLALVDWLAVWANPDAALMLARDGTAAWLVRP
jgi:cysteine-rich repeat protein